MANLLASNFIAPPLLLIFVKQNLPKAFINKGFGGFNTLKLGSLK
jgi:hypothetical protein